MKKVNDNSIQSRLVFSDDNTIDIELCEDLDDYCIENGEFKKITIDDFEGEHKCPLCGFEWND